MDTTVAQWWFKAGDQVVSADNQKLGKVVGMFPDATKPMYLVVEQGRLIHHKLHVPVSEVSNYEGNTVYVTLTKDAISGSGWDQPIPTSVTTMGSQL